jgi:hypothetical protein
VSGVLLTITFAGLYSPAFVKGTKMDKYILIAVVIIVVIGAIYYLRNPMDESKTEVRIKKEVVKNFLGGELYEIGINQLIEYTRLYRFSPMPELEAKLADYVRLSLGSQIAKQLTDEDLDEILARDVMFSVDDVIRRIDLSPLLPEVKLFLTEDKIPTFFRIEPIPLTVGYSVFFIEAETIKLIDTVKARMITQDFSPEYRNAKLGE